MRLYGANSEQILEILQSLEPSLNKVMLVGHNPAFTYCVELLSSETIDNLPTCGLVRIDFDAKKWSNLPPVPPKILIRLGF